MPYVDQLWDKLVASTNTAANAVGLKDDEAKKQQNSLMDQTISELDGIPLPVLEKLLLENPEWQSNLEFDPMEALLQEGSEFNNIETDPRLKGEQLASLDALQDISDSGGLTASDKAVMSQMQSEVATADRGRREAIKQSMAQKGMGGSGLELLQQLQSNQAATDRASQAGMSTAGMAQDRALQAIMRSGQLASGMRSQDFGEQAQKAQAQDVINKFNTSNQNNTNQFNASNQFAADKYNNQGQQAVHNQGVATNNQSNIFNNDLNQRNYDNQMGHVAAKGQARGQQIGMIGQQSDDNRKTNANMLGSAVKGITNVFGGDDTEEEEV